MIQTPVRTTLSIATLLFLGIGTASASAGTISPTDGTAPFTASSSATHTFTVKGGAFVARATSSTFNGSTTTPASSTAKINPVYSGVTCTVGGVVFAGVISSSGPWTLSSTNSVSPYTGTVTTSTTTITCTGLSGSLVFPAQTKPGLLGTNSGTNFVFGLALSGLAWTASGNVATFIGATSGTDGTYTSGGSTIIANGVNVTP